MSPHAYTEDQLVEQPAIGLFASLGWQTVSAMEETFGAGGTLRRETKGEVVLIERLRKSLTKLNALKEIEAQGWSLNPGRYVGVALGEDMSDEDFKTLFETLNEELETLNAQARTLEQTIAANATAILES